MNTESSADTIAQTKSTCYMCYNACGIVAYTRANRVLRIEGDPDNPQNYGRLCSKGRAGLYALDNPKRVVTPLKRGNSEKGIGVDPLWQPISWDQGLEIVAERLSKIRNTDARKLVGCSFDAHVYTQFFSWLAAFGTPNGTTLGADFYCGNGMHPIAALTSAAWFLEPDLDHCNFLILAGTQNGFGVNHLPMLFAEKMAAARQRGMKLVVIDPICTSAGRFADEWIPIKPGTDACFALSMANVLVNELEIYDSEFLKQHTNAPYLIRADGRYVRDAATGKPLVWDGHANGTVVFDRAQPQALALTGTYEVAGQPCAPAFQKLRDHLVGYSPEEASGVTDIPAETIRRIAKEFGAAAAIGSTIRLDGHLLPMRPACVNWYRGPCAHRHGFLTGFSLQLLNVIIGAIDVPGGHLGSNPVGPWWQPGTSDDGLLLPTDHPLGHQGMDPYPGRMVTPPGTVTCFELFPTAPYSGTMVYEALLNPELFKIPYEPEMLILCRSNPMMSTINPGVVAEALKKLPFIVAFAFDIDESTEFADLVFPDAHYLERFDAFTNAPYNFLAAGLGQWHFMIRQPVVEPPAGVRHWMDVLFELAERVGFKGDLYSILNQTLPLKAPYLLDPAETHSWAAVLDLWLKSHFGEDRGLEWFKKNGFINYREKTIEEAFPRPFLTGRIPIYVEHLLGLKKEVEAVTNDMGIPWDVSDYQPLPDWKPCPAHVDRRSEYDLFAVNCKVPFHTFSMSVGNPLLTDIQNMPGNKLGPNILLNEKTATEKGIADGDEIWVESTAGYRVRGVVKVTNSIKPGVVGFPGLYGRWARNLYKAARTGPHFNTLLPYSLDRIDTVAATMDMCIKVKVYPAAKPLSRGFAGTGGLLSSLRRIASKWNGRNAGHE